MHLPVRELINITDRVCSAILQDEDRFPEPTRFNPDRYLDNDGNLNPDAFDPAKVAFGFGKRICPSRFLTIEILWITIASILAVFKIEKVLDEMGNEITPEERFTPGLSA